MPKVAVVILNWNGIDYLKKFLPSVILHTDPGLAEIIVADNGSKDLSVDWLILNHPQVGIIRFDRNYGFAEGYNRALREIKLPYVLLLNSDVEVTSGWLEPLVNELDSDPSVAACMPKIKSFNDRESFEYAGAAGGFIDKYGYPFCRGRILYHIETDHGQYDKSMDIFWASGSCLLVRSELYFSAGGLDPFFFAHMEEIDLCWRMKNMGYRIRFCHDSEIFHLGGGTLPKSHHRKTYLNFRNNLILLIKNLPKNRVIRICTLRLFLDMIAALYFLVKLDPGETFAVFHAYFSILIRCRKIFRSRREVIKKITPGYHREIYSQSIIWNFYIRKIKEYNQLSF
jgi:GT2 family glycosyltransferase